MYHNMVTNWCLIFILTPGIYFLGLLRSVATEIDCYVCNSYNGSNPHCGDPFHPLYGRLVINCKQGRQGRMGFFPSRYCTKILGKSTSDGTETVIRSCALESLDNMCGIFELEGKRYSGCVMTCDNDACNDAVSFHGNVGVFLGMTLTLYHVLGL